MTEFIQALLGAASYSVFGFLLGWVVGYEARIIREIGLAVNSGILSEEDASTHRETAQPRRRSFGVFLVVLALVTLLQSAYFSYQQRTVTECLSEYNDTMAAVQNQRAEWNDQDRQALLTFFRAYEDSEGEFTERRREAFEDLVSTYERNTENRGETPLPQLKSCD